MSFDELQLPLVIVHRKVCAPTSIPETEVVGLFALEKTGVPVPATCVQAPIPMAAVLPVIVTLPVAPAVQASWLAPALATVAAGELLMVTSLKEGGHPAAAIVQRST